MKNTTFIVAEFHEHHIMGTLICYLTASSEYESRREYELQFRDCHSVNPMLSVRDYELSEMLSILSKVKEEIEKCEGEFDRDDQVLSLA